MSGLFLDTLNGKLGGVPPVWLMRQAGRYLPEYRALRQKARDFVQFCLTPDLAIEATLQPIRRYGFDAAILFADILLIPHALGQDLAFKEGEGPVLTPIRDAAGLAALNLSRAEEKLAPVMASVRGIRAGLPRETALIGFAGAPWTVATYMIEGAGGSDHAQTRRMAWQAPDVFAELVRLLVESTSAYLIAQADAGADTLQLFDTWAGSVPAPLFDSAVIEPARAIVSAVKAKHPAVKMIGFPRGAAARLAEYAERTGVDAVGIDTAGDLPALAATLPAHVAVQGNLDPMLLVAGGARMTAEITRLRTAMKGRRYIFNLGHGIVPETPPAHVAALVSHLRAG